jgi:hypothetical protein
MTVTPDRATRRDPDGIHVGEWIIQPGQESLDLDAREAGMLLPFSGQEIDHAREGH